MISNKCDFCHRPIVVWRYPCTTFVMEEMRWGSIGDWAACDNCASYIEKNKLDELAFLISGLEVIPGNDPTFEQQFKHQAVYAGLKELYRQFNLNRKGSRVLA